MTNDYSDGVMIALLPTTTDWSNIELPHLTLVYAGKKSELNITDFNELAKDAAMLAMLGRTLTLEVVRRETFGSNNDVDAYTLRGTPELRAMRRAVEHWNASEHPFNPHVTIGPVGSVVEVVPKYIRFDRIFVGWGTENLTFLMRGAMS